MWAGLEYRSSWDCATKAILGLPGGLNQGAHDVCGLWTGLSTRLSWDERSMVVTVFVSPEVFQEGGQRWSVKHNCARTWRAPDANVGGVSPRLRQGGKESARMMMPR